MWRGNKTQDVFTYRCRSVPHRLTCRSSVPKTTDLSHFCWIYRNFLIGVGVNSFLGRYLLNTTDFNLLSRHEAAAATGFSVFSYCGTKFLGKLTVACLSFSWLSLGLVFWMSKVLDIQASKCSSRWGSGTLRLNFFTMGLWQNISIVVMFNLETGERGRGSKIAG